MAEKGKKDKRENGASDPDLTPVRPSLSPETRHELGRTAYALRGATDAFRSAFAQLLQVRDENKPKIYSNVFRSAEVADLNYWLEIVFSIGIATLGLIINSPAVVIGAMLISPLMGPIIASGLSVALGDFYLGIKAFANVLLSSLGSIFVAAVITWVLPFHTPTPEILARVQPTLLDLGVAIFSGMAGAVVVCRGGMGGGVTALPGVAVAVALMPPLGVVGFGVGSGWNWEIIRGGGLLYLTNLVAIIFCSFLVFFAVRMDAPAVREKINEWLVEEEKGEKLYEALERTPLRRLMGRVGSLPRRVAILLVFMLMVAFPLGRTLLRLRDEANIRRVVFEEIGRAIPRDALLREQTDIAPDKVRVMTWAVLPDGPELTERELEARMEGRIGRPVQVEIRSVATHEEITALAGRTTRGEPALESVEELRARLWSRIRPAIAAAWPSDRAPLAAYSARVEPDSTTLWTQLIYISEQELGALGEAAVRRAVRARLGTGSVEVQFERLAPAAELEFPPQSTALTAEARRRLDELAALLRRFPQLGCSVVVLAPQEQEPGPRGTARATAVTEYLVQTGRIPAERISRTTATGQPDHLSLRLIPPPQP
jgi:uncharacterized hydrophobic protein (TIGR00271 family)